MHAQATESTIQGLLIVQVPAHHGQQTYEHGQEPVDEYWHEYKSPFTDELLVQIRSQYGNVLFNGDHGQRKYRVEHGRDHGRVGDQTQVIVLSQIACDLV
jgi:hypothetical protein